MGSGRKVVATAKLVLVALMALPRPAAGIRAPQAAPSGEPPRLVLEEELRIGSVDDPEYALTKVGDVRIGEGGEIYVWQPMSHRMVVFARDGRRLHTVGARGAGPGEFLGPARWTWVGDSLAGFDQDQQRYSLFTPAPPPGRSPRSTPREGSGEEGDLFALDPLGRHVTVVERGAATHPGSHRFRVYRIGLENFARLTRAEVDHLEEEGLRLPPFHPPVTDATIARDGRTWLRLERTTAGLARWMVLDLTGGVAGFVSAPAGLEIHNASDRHVWGVLHDDLDVPYVVRYRIRSGEG